MAELNVDCIDGTGTDPLIPRLREAFPEALRINSVGQMVSAIETRLGGSSNKIRRLRIFAHGHPGSQGLGRSHDSPAPDFRAIQVVGNGLGYEEILRRLKPRFAQGGWAELHGCSVGANTEGRALVTRLAGLWGVDVAAGTALQQPTHAGFELHYVVATPKGEIRERRGVAMAPPRRRSPAEATLIGLGATMLNPFTGLVYAQASFVYELLGR